MPTPNATLTALISSTPVLPLTTQGQTSAISVDTTVLPYVVIADVNTSQIEVIAYNQTTYNKNPTLVNGQNKFTGSVTIDYDQGDTVIQFLGRNYDPLSSPWVENTYYALNYRLVDSNGYVQIVVTAGISGNSIPNFSSVLGASTTDNAVVWKNLGYISVTPTLKYGLIPYISSSGVLISPPSGVSSYKAQNVCRIEWQEPTFVGTIGTRILLSTDPQGLNPVYVQYGDIVPPSQLSRSGISILSSETTSAYDGVNGTQTTTTVNQIQENNYNYIDVPSGAINGANVFYAMLSTVVQDPNTQAVFESQQTGPITCGFVNLKTVQLTDFLALQRKEDIASRMIAQVNRNYPNLDLSPRSELRDLMIDPVAIELSSMSVREWFARVSQSVSALSQIDDANGDGISDPFNSSPVKQQISRAYGLNPSDTQTFIDNQFNVLGERAGISRIGATSSVVPITFFTYVKPTTSVSFPIGIVVSTVADSQTPALNFLTTGSSSIASNSVDTYYDPVHGRWSVTVPASCQSTGSNTNVGAGTINNAGSGAPSGWYCTNLFAAAFGQDDEINSKFASRITNRLITGVDSGTRNGYLTTALKTPGVVSAKVVAAGDTEMLRDWDNIRQKHVYGCVDIYTKGVTFSEQDDVISFQYNNSGVPESPTTWITLSSFDKNTLRFQIPGVSSLPYPLYQAIKLLVTSPTGSFYFGLTRSQFDNVNGYLILNPDDLAYQVVGDSISQISIPLTLGGAQATNKAIAASLSGNITYQLLARYQSPLTDSPNFQPIVSVNSVVGQSSQTGTVDTSLINLVHTSDFLLNGGSNQAGDLVEVSTTVSAPFTKTITALTSSSVMIDSAMDVEIDANGNPGNILSVRSTDQSTLYGYGVDYTIVSTGSYRTYGIQPLNVTVEVTAMQIENNIVTVYCDNSFGIGASVTVNSLSNSQLAIIFPTGTILTVSSSNGVSFTAQTTSGLSTSIITTTGTVTGYTIQNNQQILATYNKFTVNEKLTFISNETQTLTGTAASALNSQGFVHNTWLPESYGNTSLTLDGAVLNSDGTVNVSQSTGLVGALIPHDSRYIKVVCNGNVMTENQDYVLTVDEKSGTATIARSAENIGTTRIPDGGVVTISYFITEAFNFSVEYPAFVEVLANQISETKHAAADVLVKAMVANPVDITMTVVLQPNVSADIVDPIIRSTIQLVLDSSDDGKLYQSELVQKVMGVSGVQTVQLPLVKCAKSDGSYNIGVVIPTATAWIPLSSDPAFSGIATPINSFITKSPVLPDPTIPSGGEDDAFVGLLYQGQVYNRTYSINEFLTTAVTPESSSSSGSFYIIGTNDQISATTPLSSAYSRKVIITIPKDVTNPGLRSYFATYQVFGSGSASDITLSSTEYLTTGTIQISYIVGS